MKRIFGIFAVVLLILMTTSSFASAATSQSYFKYRANPPKYAVDPALLDANGRPLGMPFCRGDIPYLICYPPSFIRKAYNFPGNLDGKGQTILIVDAFLSPTIADDLAYFDNLFGLPAPPSFTILCPAAGCPPFDVNDGNQYGWAIEQTLDVEWAHVAAPGANIVLVVATDNQDASLNAVESNAIAKYPGSVMSQSFGSPEADIGRSSIPTLVQAEVNYAMAKRQRITVLASSGDDGATTGGYSYPANPSYPSSSVWNLAVGGTEGSPYLDPTNGPYSCAPGASCPIGLVVLNGGASGCQNGTPLLQSTCTVTRYGSEQVWNEPLFAPTSATGGAISRLFPKPNYQSSLPGKMRWTSDVSLVAAINGGVLVYTSFDGPALWIVGGTSVSAPIWAGIIALVNQKHGSAVGFINPAIYSLARSSKYRSAFHDVVIGNNKLPSTAPGYNAATGWDSPTGWGTPNVANFVNDIQAYV